MSHHLDSELARQDPRLDISDIYVTKGKSGTVFIMNVNPQSGQGGFHNEARYEFKIDTTGDYKKDKILSATFGPLTNGSQITELKLITLEPGKDREELVANGQTGEILNGKHGIKFFAGSASEPFYIAGPVVGATKEAIAHGEPPALDDFDPHKSENLFGNTNVQSIVIEIPNEFFNKTTIGVWGTVDLATDAGGWRQVQRAAKPLINTLYSFGKGKDYNASEPHQDVALYGQTIEKLTARVTKAMSSALSPDRHGERVVTSLFPDVLEYQIGTKANFLHRNGRNLTDPDAENMISFVLNKQIPMGLDASDASGQLRNDFPYVGQPI